MWNASIDRHEGWPWKKTSSPGSGSIGQERNGPVRGVPEHPPPAAILGPRLRSKAMSPAIPAPATLIARVEPLTRTRAIRGPFDYRLREDQRDVGVGSLLRVPFGRQRTLGVVVEMAASSELAPERLAEPDAVLPSALPADLVELARWMAREYCSTRRPGARAGARARARPTASAAKRVLVAELTDAGRDAALAGEARLNDRQRALLEQLAAGGAAVAAALGTPALRRLEGRGLVDARASDPAAAPGRDRRRSPSASPPALTAIQQQRARRGARRARRSAAGPTTAAACCCTASPARARPRCTCGRSRPRSRPGAARSCSSPRSR